MTRLSQLGLGLGLDLIRRHDDVGKQTKSIRREGYNLMRGILYHVFHRVLSKAHKVHDCDPGGGLTQEPVFGGRVRVRVRVRFAIGRLTQAPVFGVRVRVRVATQGVTHQDPHN